MNKGGKGYKNTNRVGYPSGIKKVSSQGGALVNVKLYQKTLVSQAK